MPRKHFFIPKYKRERMREKAKNVRETREQGVEKKREKEGEERKKERQGEYKSKRGKSWMGRDRA